MIANRIIGGVSCFVWLCSAASVYAGSHTWRINELFSDATGVIQYIELHECCGSPDEILVQNLTVTSDVTGNEFVFPEFLTGDTSNAYLLLATQGFAELENAPAPDYIIADNFFALDGDVIRPPETFIPSRSMVMTCRPMVSMPCISHAMCSTRWNRESIQPRISRAQPARSISTRQPYPLFH